MEEECSLGCTTLSVPYFKGDKSGALTDAVTHALATSGNFQYVNEGGNLILQGKIVGDTTDKIGYQYDREPITGRRENRLIPNEGRREITVQITLLDSRSQRVIYGPVNVSAYNDYDFVDSDSLQDTSFFNRRGSRESALFFSLGQLDSMDGAKEASLSPIHRRLAHKIAEGLSNISFAEE